MAHHDRELPEDFHALYAEGFRRARRMPALAARTTETAGFRRLQADVPELQVDFDEVTRHPVSIASRTPGFGLGAPSPAAPEEAAVTFARQRGDLWELSDEDTATIEVQAVSQKGLKTVKMIQHVNGVEVFDSEVKVALDRNNAPMSVAGQFFPGAAAARAQRAAAALVGAEQAIAQAAFDLTGVVYEPDGFADAPAPPDRGPYRFYQFDMPANDPRPAFERPVRVKDVMFPIGEGQFIPGYYIELWLKDFPAFSYVMDAVGAPNVLFRKNLTSEAAFQYRVHNTGDAIFRPEDGPAPGTPHPTGEPDGFQAPTIVEKLIQIESLLPGDPWLPDNAGVTHGNNCFAYADLSPPNGFSTGDMVAEITAPGVFDYRYDHSLPASAAENLRNSLVGMFFHVNWLHDRWYEAGFDEAAGNAQMDNFGRGGLGGDPILAEGNDFSGKDNANMATPADGSSPRMQMFEFVRPSPLPSRTSNHEALITFHEMGHYITNRLVGNAQGLTNRQGRAMGEGWGDFFAICMTSQETDAFADGVFAVGGWTDVTPTFQDNYYFSIRRYPYSADMNKNPLTLQHIQAGVVLPIGLPRNPNGGGGNNAVHNAGEVWCAVLWEVFVNLVGKHGHAEAERRMLEYVIGGLKQTPSRPTFTQARDGIIAAVTILDPGDLPEVWHGFAKRGLGVGAVSPPSDSDDLVGVVESFDTP